MATVLKAEIELADEINSVMFDAISKAVEVRSISGAGSRLRRQFRDSPLYWIYHGGHHVAVHSHHHEHRLAIIREVQS